MGMADAGKVTFAYLKFRGEIGTRGVPIRPFLTFSDFLPSIHQPIQTC
jgi:hypothetical protein